MHKRGLIIGYGLEGDHTPACYQYMPICQSGTDLSYAVSFIEMLKQQVLDLTKRTYLHKVQRCVTLLI